MAFNIPVFKKSKEEALAMLGVGNEIIEVIIEKDYFANENIELLPKDFVSVDEIMEELNNNKNVKYLLISDAALVGLDDGKREVIKTIRSKYPDVIIAMFFDSVEPSEEFIDWAFGHKVYNIYYDAESNFNFEKVAQELASRTMPTRIIQSSDELKSKELEEKENAVLQKQKDLQDWEKSLKEMEEKLASISQEGEDEKNAKEIFLLREQIRKAQENKKELENNISEINRTHELEKQSMQEQFEREKLEYKKKIDEEAKFQIEEIKATISSKTPENTRLKTMGSITIGVFSISQGAGSTYISVALAEALGKLGYPTALVAMDGKKDLKYAGGEYAHYIVPEDADDKRKVLLETMSQGFTFIIEDFGTIFLLDQLGKPRIGEGVTDYMNETNELLRCTYKIGVGFSTPWHKAKINFFCENHMLDLETTLYAILGFENDKELRTLDLKICERDEDVIKQIMFDWLGLAREREQQKEKKNIKRGLFR